MKYCSTCNQKFDDTLSFCPTDGFVDPHSVMTGFMLKAMERGVRLMRETDVTGIATESDASVPLRTCTCVPGLPSTAYGTTAATCPLVV